MICKSCGTDNPAVFGSEICLHFPGLEGLDIPAVLVYPELAVCLQCGFSEFSIRESELRVIREMGNRRLPT
jgi:hypothetical protein